MQDHVVGTLFRAVRIRRGWRQKDVADAVGIARSVISEIERGNLDEVSIPTLRIVGDVLEIRVDLVGRWRGGEMPRLLSGRHSALHERFARYIGPLDGWQVLPEVSFSIFGERGVIDVMAWHAASGSLLIVELKSEIVDIQEMLGTLDRKRRLGRRIAAERGLGPVASVSAWLVIREDRTNRRHAADHATLLRNALPVDGRSMRTWLRQPVGSVAAMSFMSIVAGSDRSRSLTSVRRVRPRRAVGVERGEATVAPSVARPKAIASG